MADLIDGDARALVPVPRVLVRVWSYGVDPALELAVALGRITGLPVVLAIRRPIWWRRRAGPAGAIRGEPRFRKRRSVGGAVLIDDVVTTGRTLSAAHRCLPRAAYAVTATTARSERGRVPSV
jgi:predicted amidophosphoribosyltransferase